MKNTETMINEYYNKRDYSNFIQFEEVYVLRSSSKLETRLVVID